MSIIKDKSRFGACPPLEGVGGGIRKLSIFIFPIIFLFSCQNQEKEKEITSKKKESNIDNGESLSEFKPSKQSKIKDHPELFNEICSASPMEFIDLYPRVRTISDDEHENLELVQILKILGFEVLRWKSGIFKHGPRIVSFIMQKDSCKIEIDKMYYSTDTVGTFRVTESILVIE